MVFSEIVSTAAAIDSHSNRNRRDGFIAERSNR
jgi:hypothetical protein